MMRAFAAFLAVLLFITPASAFDERSAEATKPIHIAMLYHKLTQKKEPDYELMLQKWPKYKNADFVKRAEMMEKHVPEMTNAWRLSTGMEPIVVKLKAQISGYSPAQRGFLVQNFNDMTFFQFMYMGERYAVIPGKMANYQWLKAPPSLAPLVMKETKNGHETNLTLTLMSIRADKNPLMMGKVKFNLLLAEISKIEMWAADGKSVVWDSNMGSSDRKHNELLHLHQ